MSVADSLLPNGFEALEPFAEYWAVAPAVIRAERRTESTDEQRAAFFAVAKDTIPPALAYLDKKPLDQHDAKEQRLMNLLLSFAHVACAVEIQRDDEATHAQFRRYLVTTRATADIPRVTGGSSA
jgi:hypothetical protein